MQQNKLYSHILVVVGFVLLFFVTGCSDIPPGINFDNPEGEIAEADSVVTITGSVVPGTNSITKLCIPNSNSYKAPCAVDIPIAEDGTFTYDYTVDNTIDIFSTCIFKVVDSKFLSNMERISFFKGDEDNMGIPDKPDGDFNGDGVVNNAANVLLNEKMLNVVTQAALDIVNSEINDILADDVLPITEGEGIVTVEIDSITMGAVTIEGNEEGDPPINIGNNPASPQVSATELSVESVALGGTLSATIPIFIWDLRLSQAFDLTISNINLGDMPLEVFVKESTNDICLRILDVDSTFDDAFFLALDIDVDLAGWGIIDEVIDLVIGLFKRLVGVIMRAVLNSLQIPLLDVDNLEMTLDTGEMDLGGIILDMSLFLEAWFPNAMPGSSSGEYWIFETPGNDEMYIPPIGIAVTPSYPGDSPNPLDYYYATPTEEFPDQADLAFEEGYENNNLSLGVNDDLINMGVWAAMQTGFMEEMNLTSVFGSIAGEVLWGAFSSAKVNATLRTPPYADFSTPVDPVEVDDDGLISSVGKIVVRDLKIDINDFMVNRIIDTVRMSVDVDVVVDLKVTEDGKTVEAFMGEGTSIDIVILYVNNINADLVRQLGNDIITYVMNNVVLPSLLTIEVPVVELYGAAIQPHIYSTEIDVDRNMILKLGVSEPEPDPDPAP